MKLVLSQCSTG